MTHDFITIATGDTQYYKMAVNLLHSYRYFSASPLPFAILADQENEYTAEFDTVRLFSHAHRNYLEPAVYAVSECGRLFLFWARSSAGRYNRLV